jgi:flagellar FliL protein
MADDNEPKEAKSGGKLKKIILIVVPVLLVGGGAAFFFMGGEGEESAPETTVPVEGEVIEVDTLTVNIVGEENRYARVGFAVVLNATADSGAVGLKVPLLQDAALAILTRYDAATLQSPEGQERLRQELSEASVALFPDGEVLRAVLTELIVQ